MARRAVDAFGSVPAMDAGEANPVDVAPSRLLVLQT